MAADRNRAETFRLLERLVVRTESNHSHNSKAAMKRPSTILPFGTILLACVACLTYANAGLWKRGLTHSPPLSCTIISDKQVYKTGEVPKLTVTIKNQVDKPIYLVGSLDGSDVRWRYPHCYYEITGPNGKPVVTGIGRCGNMNSLRVADFAKLDPNQSFNPYQPKRFFSCYQISKGSFAVAGNYTVYFIYSTKERKIENWLGDGRWAWKKKRDGELQKLFRQIPKVVLRSNKLTLKFVE
jgi:hypothetical protein